MGLAQRCRGESVRPIRCRTQDWARHPWPVPRTGHGISRASTALLAQTGCEGEGQCKLVIRRRSSAFWTLVDSSNLFIEVGVVCELQALLRGRNLLLLACLVLGSTLASLCMCPKRSPQALLVAEQRLVSQAPDLFDVFGAPARVRNRLASRSQRPVVTQVLVLQARTQLIVFAEGVRVDCL